MEGSNGIGMYNVAKGAMEVKYTMEEHNGRVSWKWNTF